jgi:hypothetical protein
MRSPVVVLGHGLELDMGYCPASALMIIFFSHIMFPVLGFTDVLNCPFFLLFTAVALCLTTDLLSLSCPQPMPFIASSFFHDVGILPYSLA